MEDIFCKIIKGEIPSTKVYEDENMLIIKDINPEASIHLLMMPKKHIKDLSSMSEEDSLIIGKCLKKVADLSESLGLANGYRVITNVGSDGGQSVPHLHFHILGGEKLCEKVNTKNNQI